MIQWIKDSVCPLSPPHFIQLLNKQDVFTEKNLRLLFLLDHYLRFCNNRYVKELTICELKDANYPAKDVQWSIYFPRDNVIYIVWWVWVDSKATRALITQEKGERHLRFNFIIVLPSPVFSANQWVWRLGNLWIKASAFRFKGIDRGMKKRRSVIW